MSSETELPAPPLPADGIGAGGAATEALGAAGGLNICVWQSWLPAAIQTRSQPMNFTVFPSRSPPRRRSTLLPLSLVDSIAANDQSGSADAAMTRTRTPSQSGA